MNLDVAHHESHRQKKLSFIVTFSPLPIFHWKISSILILLLGINLASSGSICFAEDSSSDNSPELSEQDQILIDTFLDEVLTIDPLDIGSDPSQDTPNDPWLTYGFGLFGGLGLEKNVLKLSWLKLDSVKYDLAADFYLTLGRPETQVLDFYLYYELEEYPDINSQSNNNQLFSSLAANWKVTPSNQIGLMMSVTNQTMFDTDNAQNDQAVPAYLNEQISVSPDWVLSFGEKSSLSLELGRFRQLTSNPVDDHEKSSLALEISVSYGHDSRAIFTIREENADFLESEISDLNGDYLENTLLKTELRSARFWNHHNWSDQTGISSLLVYAENRDNGPGYTHYNFINWNEAWRFQIKGWMLNASFGYSYYHYTARTISEGALFYITNTTIRLNISKELKTDLILNSSIFAIKSDSNQSADRYESGFFRINLAWYI